MSKIEDQTPAVIYQTSMWLILLILAIKTHRKPN
jgi:hypothetical protein